MAGMKEAVEKEGEADNLLSRDSGSSAHLTSSSWTQLVPLRTAKDTQCFLRSILHYFVEIVDVVESGFLDDLVEQEVLNDWDKESLYGSHLPTRHEKARRLWNILFEIDHRMFSARVLPALCKHFWHIIPQRFWLPGDATRVPEASCSSLEGADLDQGARRGCTRCAIQRRVRPVNLGDFHMHAGLITSREHREIISNYRMARADWSKIFHTFKKLGGCRDIGSHVTHMHKLMIQHSLPVPGNLCEMMINGFPCTCPTSGKSGLCLLPSRFACLRSAFSSSEGSLPSLASGVPVSIDLQASPPACIPGPLSPCSTASASLPSVLHPLGDCQHTPLQHTVSVGSCSHARAGSWRGAGDGEGIGTTAPTPLLAGTLPVSATAETPPGFPIPGAEETHVKCLVEEASCCEVGGTLSERAAQTPPSPLIMGAKETHVEFLVQEAVYCETDKTPPDEAALEETRVNCLVEESACYDIDETLSPEQPVLGETRVIPGTPLGDGKEPTERGPRVIPSQAEVKDDMNTSWDTKDMPENRSKFFKGVTTPASVHITQFFQRCSNWCCPQN